MPRTLLAAFVALLPCAAFAARPAPVPVLAAESVYADIAEQVGGADAAISAVLRSPRADPHVYEPAPSVARAVAGAAIVIENGIGYDPWMDRLLAAAPVANRTVIVIADLLHRSEGANDHLWYDPAAVPALQVALCDALARRVADLAGLARRCGETAGTLAAVQERIAGFRARYAGARVAATEPVLGNLLPALGLADHGARFELAVMNGIEPRASDTARLEDDVRERRVRLLIANAQATTPAAERLKAVAQQAGVPVLSVTETLPAGMHYQTWLTGTLDALSTALGHEPERAP